MSKELIDEILESIGLEKIVNDSDHDQNRKRNQDPSRWPLQEPDKNEGASEKLSYK